METRSTARLIATGLGMFLTCALTCQASGIDVIGVQIDPSAIVWESVQGANLVLTVSGPGGVFRHQFEAGDQPSLAPVDARGAALPDGGYTWEIRQNSGLKKDRADDDKVAGVESGVESPGAPRSRLRSGHFTIRGGLFLDPTARETEQEALDVAFGKPRSAAPATKDQLISDDLIVDGLLCVGTDCVLNENFGTDTLRLKQNNVRLKFDDTSLSPTYPKRDWQITANDNTPGGAEKFSIEDVTAGTTPFTIQGEAPAHSLHVNSAGRVGFGTSVPLEALHVITGNEPSLRLEQDGSDNFAAQTWAVGGSESGFFVKDVTNFSKKPFRVRSGAPTSSLEIHSSGRIGVATNDPDHQLDIFGSGGDQEASLKVSNSGEALLLLENRTSTDLWTISVTDLGIFEIAAGSGRFTMADDGDAEFSGDVKANGILLTSDRDRKTAFRDLDGRQVLEALAEVPVSTWAFKSDARAVRHIGPMAQDFHRAFGAGPDDRHISPMDMGGVALAAIQELHQQMKALIERNAELEARLAELER